MSTRNQYPVGAQIKGFKNKIRVNPAGTQYPDNPHIGWILKTADTCQVSGGIGTPVTRKCDDLWIKFFSHNVNPLSIVNGESGKSLTPLIPLIII
jgi:hypothetical protein